MTTNHTYRIVANCPELDEYPLVLDVQITPDKELLNVPFFGIYGKVTGTFFPFVLQKHHTIDYGADYEEPTRERPCNLRQRKIELGTQFAFQEWEESSNSYRHYVFTIKQLVPTGAS